MNQSCSFNSFFLGGFECSTHRRPNGQRLDLIASTCHDRYAREDYERLQHLGIRTARDGVRWHLIEQTSGRYDWSSLLPMLREARETHTQIIWDLCHYGWPDWLDIFSADFVDAFARFCRCVALLIDGETDGVSYFSPMNEISFFSWAGAEVGILSPFVKNRGYELKCQLVRATIAGIDAIREELPDARFVQIDPLIQVVPAPGANDEDRVEAERYNHAQYQAWDMLAGQVEPSLGGHPRYLDIVGGNYYVHNQWEYGAKFIERTDPRYRPFHHILHEVWKRYNRPVFVAETGIEDARRPEWFRYVCDEVLLAMKSGVPVGGVCLYPIVNHPGWEDDRHCHNGLWDYCNDCGQRDIYIPLAEELAIQQARLQPVYLAHQCPDSEFDQICA